MKHTPTPYRKGTGFGAVVADTPEGTNEVDDYRAREGHVECYGGYVVAESCVPADAAFIVEACNAYESLTKAKADADAAVLVAAKTIEYLRKRGEVLIEALSSAAQYIETSDVNLRDRLIEQLKAIKEKLTLCEGEGVVFTVENSVAGDASKLR